MDTSVNGQQISILQAVNCSTPVQVVKPTLRIPQDMPPSCNKLQDTTTVFGSQGVLVNKHNKDCKTNESISEGIETEVENDPEFEWNDYLDSSGAVAAPHTLFLHVEHSLQTLFTQGMKLEIPNRHCPNTYWVASVVMSCGPLLRLRYEGYDNDRSDDFWWEISSGDIHPIGWCATNNKILQPPPAIKYKHEDWDQFLKSIWNSATTIPTYLLESNGCTAVDQIKHGMKLEVQDDANATHVWVATVIENVGGRLLLRYDGVYVSNHDFWLFYLSYRVHPVGWTKQNDGYEYKPPSGLVESSPSFTSDWSSILATSLKESEAMPVPSVIFANQEKLEKHNFKAGMRLEMIYSPTLALIHPATVTKVLNSYYFIVDIDNPHPSLGMMKAVCCHANSPFIFPAGWAKSNGLSLVFPNGWNQDEQDFDWEKYEISSTDEQIPCKLAPSHLFNNKMLDHGFEKGMKLEAVNPYQPRQICVATINRVVENILWIQLDHFQNLYPNHIVPADSQDIYPVGWCDSNHYPLKVPISFQQEVKNVLPEKKVAIVIPEKQKKLASDGKADEPYDIVKDVREIQATGKAWCPELYVNHKCFSGPFLSKARIAGLPRHVGPGPVTLVLKEILSLIVGVSYLPSRVLSVLQVQGDPTPGMDPQLIKAKYKQKSYRAMIETIRNSDKVKEYCRSICTKLQCCPNLFGPDFFGDNCPENCYTLTKTKNIKKGKKRRKNKLMSSKPSPTGEDNDPKVEESNSEDFKIAEESVKNSIGDCPKVKRKYVHKIMPKSDIVTRGAKIPNFALELRRRRRQSVTRNYLSRIIKSIIHKPVTPHRPHLSSVIVKDHQKKRYLMKSENHSEIQNRTDSEVTSVNITLSPGQQTPSVPIVPANESSSSNVDLSVQGMLRLATNPLHWNVSDVVAFIKGTDCAQMARLLKEQEIDGQALLLLTLPTIQEHLELKLGPAIKLCNHIERVKLAFYSQFAT